MDLNGKGELKMLNLQIAWRETNEIFQSLKVYMEMWVVQKDNNEFPLEHIEFAMPGDS